MKAVFGRLGLSVAFFVGFYCLTQNALSQDVLVVHGGKEIRAKVISIGSEGVEYRLYDVEDSPLYKLPLQEVVSLTYENGRVEDFSIFLPKEKAEKVEKEEVVTTTSPQEIRFYEKDNSFYLGNNILPDDEIRRILSDNSSALEMWKKGNRIRNVNLAMKIAAGPLWVAGGIVTIIAFTAAIAEVALFPLFIFIYPDIYSNNNVDALFITGLALLGAGAITTVMIPVTKTKYKSCYSDAANTYNKGLQKTAVSLHIGATGNGLGFSLKF
jgi:hypothetical protein